VYYATQWGWTALMQSRWLLHPKLIENKLMRTKVSLWMARIHLMAELDPGKFRETDQRVALSEDFSDDKP